MRPGMTEGLGTGFLLKALALQWSIFAVAGCFTPALFGTYFSKGRCLCLFTFGALTFLVIFWTSYAITRLFSLMMGVVLGGSAFYGFTRGVPGFRRIGVENADLNLLVLFNGQAELGRNDHYLHLISAIVCLIAAVAPTCWDSRTRPIPGK